MKHQIALDSVVPAAGPPPDVAALDVALAALRDRYPGALFRRYLALRPEVHDEAWVAEGAVLVGDVRLAAGASVWFGCVLRADLAPITVGPRSNLQDGTVVHLGDKDATVVGADVTVGHGAILHGCTLHDACLVGMRATVLDGAVVGEGSVIGAGAVVPAGTVVPPLSLVMGLPGRVVRALPPATLDVHRQVAAKYLRLVHNHRRG